MSETSFVPITPGNGVKKGASYKISEDGVDKEIQRAAINDPNGNDVFGEVSETPAEYTVLWHLDRIRAAVLEGGIGGGGSSATEYAEDAAPPANPVGPALMARRRDTLTAAEVSADGDMVALNATNKGELRTSDSGVLTELTTIKEHAEAAKNSLSVLENDTSPATTEFDEAALGPRAGADALAVTTARDDIKVTPVTFTPDTSALAAGDVIVDTQIVAACVKADDAGGVLQSFTLACQSDQGVALRVFVLNANVSLGTENSPPSISDANALKILGWFDIEATDYVDLGGVRVASIKNIGITVTPVPGSDDLYMAIVNRDGTPTFSASSLVGLVGIVC